MVPGRRGKLPKCYTYPTLGGELLVATRTTIYREQALAELDAVPDEYLPFVIQLVRSFREGLGLKAAAASFRQGWAETRKGETYPVDSLWNGIDAG
jgi:hypothetical protein